MVSTDLRALFLVGTGGAIGSMMRFAVSDIMPYSVFPWATLTVNFLGSFLLVYLLFKVVREHHSSEALSLFLLMGLLGGFTTFSTFSLETMGLMVDGRWSLAITNVALNLSLCLFGAFAGMSWGNPKG